MAAVASPSISLKRNERGSLTVLRVIIAVAGECSDRTPEPHDLLAIRRTSHERSKQWY